MASRRLRTALCALALTLMGCQRVGGEAFQETFNQPLALTREVVGQSFRPATGGIAAVNVLLATYDAEPDPAGTLRAVLREGVGGPVLARIEVPGTALGNNEWAPLRFAEPVPSPEVAALELTWDGASPLAVWADVPLDGGTDAFPNDPYPGGQLLLGGEPAPGDLAFRVVGTGGLAALPGTLAGIARQGLGRLADDPAFAVGWGTLLAAAGSLAVAGLRRPARQRRERGPGEEHGQDEERRAGQPQRLAGEGGRVQERVAQAGQARGQFGGERLERAERRP
jgi:membrane protein implicated in regulation of membrane protease activity